MASKCRCVHGSDAITPCPCACRDFSVAPAPASQVPYLGTRRRDDKGRLGAYSWLSYSQVGDMRTSIGSGLLQLGLRPKAAVGLYSVNCKGKLAGGSAGCATCRCCKR